MIAAAPNGTEQSGDDLNMNATRRYLIVRIFMGICVILFDR
jgi:hypothetical protein